jgi:hypothetical protein
MIWIRYDAPYSSAPSGHIAFKLPNPGLNPGLSSDPLSGERLARPQLRPLACIPHPMSDGLLTPFASRPQGSRPQLFR